MIQARFRANLGRFALDANFEVPARGVTALFGPSGCGKTSVLRAIAGLNRIATGYVAIDHKRHNQFVGHGVSGKCS
jgi:molybdate transport system ATP-binding protein